MRLLLLLAIIIPMMVNAQNEESTNKLLQELEDFMTEHIPSNHMSVKGYKLTIKGSILKKKTLVDDGTSHTTTFDLKNAVIDYNFLQMDDEAAEVYGFKDYWDVSINNDWIHTELLQESDAELMVDLIKSIQKSCLKGN